MESQVRTFFPSPEAYSRTSAGTGEDGNGFQQLHQHHNSPSQFATFLHSPASVSSSSYDYTGCDTDFSGDESSKFTTSFHQTNMSGCTSPASSVLSTSPEKSYQHISRRDMALMSRVQEKEISTSTPATTPTSSPKKTGSPGQPRTRRTRKKSPTVVLRMKKFRRLKANDRERQRMHLLNAALERLRLVLPSMPQDQRLTKIETLRFAHNYIWALIQSVGVIKTLNSSNSSIQSLESDLGSIDCQIIDGNYVVNVGNVRIVLDREGRMVETLATRPSTPPPEDYQLIQQDGQYFPPDDDINTYHYHQFCGNNNNNNVDNCNSTDNSSNNMMMTSFNEGFPAPPHFCHMPNNNRADAISGFEQPPHVPGTTPFGHQNHRNHKQLPGDMTPSPHRFQQQQLFSRSAAAASNFTPANQPVMDIDNSSNYSFTSSFEDDPEPSAMGLGSSSIMFDQKAGTTANNMSQRKQPQNVF